MEINLLVILRVFLVIAFILYWYLVFKLVDTILNKPKLKKFSKLIISTINSGITILFAYLGNNFISLYVIIFVLLMINFTVFYKDTFGKRLFCASACIIHVMILQSIVISIFTFLFEQSSLELYSVKITLTALVVVAFAIIDLAIIAVLYYIPKDKIKILNDHKEQQWFLIAWMTVFNLYLLYNAEVFSRPIGLSLSENGFIAPLAIILGLYIILFFSFKTAALLRYKEKSEELQQTVYNEQQFRNAATKGSLITYDINFTQDTFTCDSNNEIFKNLSNCFSEMIIYISEKNVHYNDKEKFLKFSLPSNIIYNFENGKSENILEYRRLFNDGRYKWVRAKTNLVKEFETGDIVGFVYIKDIDDEKKQQLKLQFKAERDPLTEVYNKEVTKKLIDVQLESGESAALLMIDIDNFKDINDNFGHVYGDAVLCDLADKLQKIFRSKDIIGRIGGDEFMAFIKGSDINSVTKLKAEEICKAFKTVYKKDSGDEYIISSSIGISIYPNDGSTFEDLYRNADIALYESKRKGKDTYSFYDGREFESYESARTEIKQAGSLVQKNFKHNRIEYVFKILYQSENPFMAIHSVLELVTRHFSFERGYIFETSVDGLTTSNTFEWCAEGTLPQIDVLQNIPIELVATAHSNFYKTGIFILKSLNDLPRDQREILEPQDIKSMFQFGIFDKENLLGFIGFDNCNDEMVTTDAEVDEMTTICNILSTFFVKQYVVEKSNKFSTSLKEVMNHLENYIYVVQANTLNVLFMNGKTNNLMKGDQPLDEFCFSFFRGNTEQCHDCPIRNIENSSDSSSSVEMYNSKLNIWVKATATTLIWMDGSKAYLVNCVDVTQQKTKHLQHISELEKIAYYDELTGCKNYYKFKEDAQQILENNKDKKYMLIKLDIYNFRVINQIYGYDKGDQILCYVAKAVEMSFKNENELFARRGNDEFVVLLQIDKYKEVEERYESFLKYFEEMIEKKFIFKFTFPHGRFIINPGAIDNSDIMEMFEKVNIAHKAAKLDKSVEYVLYDESLNKKNLHQKEIENRMEEALSSNDFLVYLQPKYYLENEKIGGAEALVRWKYAVDHIMLPGEFISIFEQNGFIVKLDFYVLHNVCALIRKWIDEGIEPVTISVNFSRIHLSNANFIKDLCEIVDGFNIERKYIEIEVTETAIYENIDSLVYLLDELHREGFTMSMDDFGSGYSSLGMLQNLKVDVIKLDRSFFINQTDEQRSKTVVGSVIEMASNLGIKIVAEGVEEKEQIDFLRELLCDMAQGYYFEKPIEVESFKQLLLKGRMETK